MDLFAPYSLAGLRLPNRFVRAATYEKLATEEGHATSELAALYRALARGGVGLIITGGALVHPTGRMLRRMLCLHSEIYMDSLRRLTDAVHEEGGLVGVQLVHGGRQCPPLMLGGQRSLAPSEVPDPVTGSRPSAMSDAEIWGMVEAFGEAAYRARAAGFDALELQGGHGYLISNFLSPATNLREDYWGGDSYRRSHFLEEVLRAVREAVGREFPVIVKLNTEDLVPGGLEQAEAAEVARRAELGGADAIEASGGVLEANNGTIRDNVSEESHEAYFAPGAALMKAALSIPLILTGGMRSRVVMERVINSGIADLIGMARPFIREPDLVLKMREGKERADCTACAECTRFGRLTSIKCVVQ